MGIPKMSGNKPLETCALGIVGPASVWRSQACLNCEDRPIIRQVINISTILQVSVHLSRHKYMLITHSSEMHTIYWIMSL